MNLNYMKKNKSSGFTLLELLIVIAIIAILSVALVLVLNPSETLKKARDSQRISDLSTLKTAIGLYITNTSTPLLNNVAANAGCKATASGARALGGSEKVYYSYPSDSPGAPITDATVDGATTTPVVQVLAANYTKTAGTGWLPINFDGLPGGSPISSLPIDPVNTVATAHLSAIDNTDLVYRYSCAISPLTYELDAVLESAAFVTTDPKMTTDGGNNSSYYETGTNMFVLGAGTDF